jgi:hypothetical protein
VAQLVKALDYKPKVAGSIPDGVNGIFRWHCVPGVYSASNRNE